MRLRAPLANRLIGAAVAVGVIINSGWQHGALRADEQDHAVLAEVINDEGRPPGWRGQPGSYRDVRADGPFYGSRANALVLS